MWLYVYLLSIFIPDNSQYHQCSTFRPAVSGLHQQGGVLYWCHGRHLRHTPGGETDATSGKTERCKNRTWWKKSYWDFTPVWIWIHIDSRIWTDLSMKNVTQFQNHPLFLQLKEISNQSRSPETQTSVFHLLTLFKKKHLAPSTIRLFKQYIVSTDGKPHHHLCHSFVEQMFLVVNKFTFL